LEKIRSYGGGPEPYGERKAKNLDRINKIYKMLFVFNLVNLVNPVKKFPTGQGRGRNHDQGPAKARSAVSEAIRPEVDALAGGAASG